MTFPPICGPTFRCPQQPLLDQAGDITTRYPRPRPATESCDAFRCAAPTAICSQGSARNAFVGPRAQPAPTGLTEIYPTCVAELCPTWVAVMCPTVDCPPPTADCPTATDACPPQVGGKAPAVPTMPPLCGAPQWQAVGAQAQITFDAGSCPVCAVTVTFQPTLDVTCLTLYGATCPVCPPTIIGITCPYFRC